MASAVKTLSRAGSRRITAARPAKPRRRLYGVVAAIIGIAAVSWTMATVATVQTMAPALSSGKANRIEASLGLKAVERDLPLLRQIHVPKFSRLSSAPIDQAERDRLTADLIRSSHHKMAAIRSAQALKKSEDKARAFAIAAARLRAEKEVAAARQVAEQPILVTALVDSKPLQDGTITKPFGLVLAEKGTPLVDSETPDTIVPLPEARPERLTTVVPEATAKTIETPADKKTPAAAKDTKRTVAKELAYARPDKSLFEGLFGGGNKRGWPGGGSKVAIYDISGGLVYMPDGSKLEAHSGIDEMRDNPKFVHKKMRGSTPPGTFKLTMREKRFHGVEALRMTPTNGVHPHGRDGLLTHSYLLGRSGNSHGCVAFKDYQPFLKAFKRGNIDTMIVVPSLPASRTQIASLIARAT